MDTREILTMFGGYIFSAITGVVGWFASSRKRRNDALSEMQESIDLLAQKNNDLIEEITKLRIENSSLKAEIEALRAEVNSLRNGE
ncbi:MAG: hypothetical protein MJZ96_01610 [Paludibacteraceae bacterium]|nr:hypothetical protein [Paludibacteraceae bacterium]